MTLPWMAQLVPAKPRERGVAFYGSSRAYVTSVARGWLDASGEHGDTFVIYEIVETERARIECDKPAPLPPEPKAGRHAFKPQARGIYCDTCGSSKDAH